MRAELSLVESCMGRGSEGSKHSALLNWADFCRFCYCSDPLLPNPKITDNVTSTVALCLIHSLSCAYHKNIAKNPITVITNALHPCLKSRALSQVGQIFVGFVF